MRHAVVDLGSQPIRNRLGNPSAVGNLNGWSTNDATLFPIAYSATGGVDGGSCARVMRSAVNPSEVAASFYFGVPPGGGLLSQKVIPGERLQAGFMVKTDVASRDAVIYIQYRDVTGTPGVVAGETRVPLTQGGWTWVSTPSVIVPAGADSILIVGYVRTAAGDVSTIPANEVTLFDQIYLGAPLGRYADGDSPGWRWTGTAHASESVGYSWTLDPRIVRQEIRNRHSNPTLSDGTRRGWAGNDANLYLTSAVATGGVNGGSCFQLTRTANNPGGTAASLYSHGYPDAGGLLQMKVQPGDILQGSWAVKPGAENRRAVVYLTFRDSAGAQITQLGATNTVLTSTSFTRAFSQVVTAPARADSVLIGGTVVVTDGSVVPAGEVTLVDQAFVGPPHDYYADGDTPGWRWLGTAGASPSTGFPYTLEQIAGPPLASVTVPGTQSAPMDLAPTEGRTLYVVHASLSNNDVSTNSMGTIGTPDASSFSGINAGAGGEGTMAVRTNGMNTHYIGRVQQIGAATSGLAIAQDGSRQTGMHVSVLSVPDDLATVAFTTDSFPRAVVAVPAGAGLNASPKLGLSAVSPAERPVRALAYRGQHDVTTERRIVAWLARQYGAPVPTGY